MLDQYQLNEGRFELPMGLKDRTVHMFAPEDEGPSDFTLVITRASNVTETSIEAFTQRLSKELRKGLTRFELKSDLPRIVGDSPARDLAYTWRSEDQVLYQRQVVLLTQAGDGSRNALQFIATSPKALTPQWTERFEAMLDSVVLHDGVAVAAAPASLSDDRSPPPPASPTSGPSGDLWPSSLSRQL